MKRANLFLVACPRSGSTQLARWLDSHPTITCASIKEPNHFSAHEFSPQYVRESGLNDVDPARYLASAKRPPAQFAVFRDGADYAALFADMATQWRMEASTSYLACPEAPSAIYAYNPEARIILLTRDPLERAISHYRLARRTGRTNAPITEELAAELAGTSDRAAQFLLRPSCYQSGLAAFRETFAADQVHQLSFEALIGDRDAELARLCRFLEVDVAALDLSREARNRGVAPRFPAVNRLLQKSGLKTILRRHLPRPLKRRLAGIYFDQTRQIAITESERRLLTSALEAGQ